MKLLITHLLSAVVGFCVAAYGCLFLASLTSLVWQDSIKTEASNFFRLNGAKAVRQGDWASAGKLFRTSNDIAVSIKPSSWSISYPLHAWRLIQFVKYPDDTFSISDLSMEAYSLKKQGRLNEANYIYAELLKKNPSKNQAYFDAIAEQTLSALNAYAFKSAEN
jgi:hypothetical protein